MLLTGLSFNDLYTIIKNGSVNGLPPDLKLQHLNTFSHRYGRTPDILRLNLFALLTASDAIEATCNGRTGHIHKACAPKRKLLEDAKERSLRKRSDDEDHDGDDGYKTIRKTLWKATAVAALLWCFYDGSWL